VVVANLLAAAQTRRAATALSFHGQPLVKLLRNENTTGTNLLTLDELLTCRFIGNGADSGRANFELPVNYNILTNLGRLHLLLDGELDAASLGEAGERQTCERATNGNCLLTWQSSYDPPGLHAIQAEFVGCREDEPNENALKVTGPVLAFASTNLCQFDSAYDRFDSYSATLYARLPESNGVYAIEITTPSGEHLKTFAGTTTNGVIKVHWDLVDDHGQRFTNSSFDSVFHVTLPDSGRSQTLKGP
jgi:hypothetical protein